MGEAFGGASGLSEIRLATLRGGNRLGFMTGPELSALVARVQAQGEVGEAAEELMIKALEKSTWAARANHMAAMCAFLESKRLDFPLTERDLVAFVGYLYSCMITKTGTQLRAASLPGYLSGIRLTHEALGLGPLPLVRESLRLKAVCEGYGKMADKKLPPTAIRISIPAHVLYDVLRWAAQPRTSARDLRDACLLITATVFGLRAAGVQSILYENVECDAGRFQVLVGALKGRTLQAALRRGGRAFYAPEDIEGFPLTVLELVREWTAARGAAPGPFFDADGLSVCNLDYATKRIMRAVGFEVPQGCEVSGHSPRITAFSQAVLLSWSDVRLRVRFDWKNLADMADVYLDHRVRASVASRVFFSPSLPEPVAAEWEGGE